MADPVVKHLLFGLSLAGAALGQPNLSDLNAAWTDNFKVFPSSLTVDNDGNSHVLGGGLTGFVPTNPQYGPAVGSITVVLKLDPLGKLAWSTGIGSGQGFGLAIDSAGNVYIAGVADGNSFPTTPGAFQTRLNKTAAYAAKLNGNGQLEWATLLGAEDTASEARAIAVDATGVFVAGDAQGPSFPTTPGAFQPTTKKNRPADYPDCFIVKLNLTGSALVFSTLLGGTQGDNINKIAIDNQGDVYALGTSRSLDFPVTPGAYQTTGCVFLAKMNAAGSRLIYSTFVSRQAGPYPIWGCTTDGLSVDFTGSSSVAVSPHILKINYDGTTLMYDRSLDDAQVFDLTSDSSGNAYVTGSTAAYSFPIPAPCFVSIAGVPTPGADFILRLDASGAIADGGYLPFPPDTSRRVSLVRLDPNGNFYIVDPEAGETTARKFTPGLRSSLLVSLRCVVNAGHLGKAAVAPGEIVALFGDGIGPAQAASMELDASGKVTKILGNTQVLFDGIPAPLLYAQSRHINAVAPWELKGRKTTEACVVYAGVKTNCITLPVAEISPGLFRIGEGGVVALNEDSTVNSPQNPAKKGSIMTVFLTGSGPSIPPQEDGEVTQSVLPSALTVKVSSIQFFGSAIAVYSVETPAEVLLHSPAPGLVSGVELIQFRVPLVGFAESLYVTMQSSTGDVFSDGGALYVFTP